MRSVSRRRRLPYCHRPSHPPPRSTLDHPDHRIRPDRLARIILHVPIDVDDPEQKGVFAQDPGGSGGIEGSGVCGFRGRVFLFDVWVVYAVCESPQVCL